MDCSECDGNKTIVRGRMYAPPILISAFRRRLKQLFILSSNEHVRWAIFKIDLDHLLHASSKQNQVKSISIYVRQIIWKLKNKTYLPQRLQNK